MKLFSRLFFSLSFFALSLSAQTIVKDINSDSTNAFAKGLSPQFTFWSGSLYFVANNGTHGHELWKSNGTAAGTSMVKDIRKGPFSSDPEDLTVFNNALFFLADDGTGMALWKTTGMDSGTVKVKSFSSRARSFSPSRAKNRAKSRDVIVKYTAVIGKYLYFVAEDENGLELWRTDGTTAGTVLVKDINPTNDSDPNNFIVMNNLLYFCANDGTHGYELWKSDGTANGTVMIEDINAQDAGAGTTFPSDPEYLTVLDNVLYFAADDGVNGKELWKSAGSAGTTQMVKDICVGIDGSAPSEIVSMNGLLYFAATDGSASQGTELWKSDGTDPGTTLVKDIYAGVDGSDPANLTVVGKTLFFSANNGTHGNELWRSNGTAESTVLVVDLHTLSSDPGSFAAVGSTLYFAAADENSGRELWKTDGSLEGTVRIKDINSNATPPIDSDPEFLINANGVVYFTAYDGSSHNSRIGKTGRELWKSQGTEATTLLAADINKKSQDAFTNNMANLNKWMTHIGTTLYFVAKEQDENRIWKTTGTDAGTSKTTPTYTSYNQIQGTSTTLFFTRDDGTIGNDALYRDNNTNAGEALEDQTNTKIRATSLYAAGANLYFKRADDIDRLWVTDGTKANTNPVKEGANFITSFDNAPGKAVVFNNALYCIAHTGSTDSYLLKVSGATATIVKKTDINGLDIKFPSDLTVLGGKTLFFKAEDPIGRADQRLWRLNMNGFGELVGVDVPYKIIGGAGTWLYFAVYDDFTAQYFLYQSNGLASKATTNVSSSPVSILVTADPIAMAAGSILYFQARYPDDQGTLYQTDGNDKSAKPVKDADNRLFSGTTLFGASGSNLYFVYNDDIYGNELWTTTGTPAATKITLNLNLFGNTDFYRSYLIGTTLYFVANEGTYGIELWKK